MLRRLIDHPIPLPTLASCRAFQFDNVRQNNQRCDQAPPQMHLVRNFLSHALHLSDGPPGNPNTDRRLLSHRIHTHCVFLCKLFLVMISISFPFSLWPSLTLDTPSRRSYGSTKRRALSRRVGCSAIFLQMLRRWGVRFAVGLHAAKPSSRDSTVERQISNLIIRLGGATYRPVYEGLPPSPSIMSRVRPCPLGSSRSCR
jgi:hypothetical protein